MNNSIKKNMYIDSNKVLNKNFKTLDLQGMDIDVNVFKKADNLLDSTIFGIPLKYILIVTGIIWVIKRK